jgi:hypothetical protein
MIRTMIGLRTAWKCVDAKIMKLEASRDGKQVRSKMEFLNMLSRLEDECQE